MACSFPLGSGPLSPGLDLDRFSRGSAERDFGDAAGSASNSSARSGEGVLSGVESECQVSWTAASDLCGFEWPTARTPLRSIPLLEGKPQKCSRWAEVS